MRSFREYLEKKERVLNEGVMNKIVGAILGIILSLGAIQGVHADNSQFNASKVPQAQERIFDQFGVRMSPKEIEKTFEIAQTEGKEEAEDFITFSIRMPETNKSLKSSDVNRLVSGSSPLLQNKKEMSDAYKNNSYGFGKKDKNKYVENMTGASCYFLCLNYIPQYEFNERLTADQMAEISRECHSKWEWSDEHKKMYQAVGGLVSHSAKKTDKLDAWVNSPNTVANMAYKMLKNPKDYKDATADWRKATENGGPIKRIGIYKKGEKIPKTGYDYIIVKLPQASGDGTHFVLCDRNMNLIYDPYSTSKDLVSNSLQKFLKSGNYIELYLFKVN